MFSLITGINESKTLTRHISYECKCKVDGTKCNSNQQWNNNKCWCECKKHHICEKVYIWNASTSICENGKYLASIMDDSVITCDEVIGEVERGGGGCAEPPITWIPFVNLSNSHLTNQ